MAKRITKIVLTGGPAAGKTTLVSRVLKEFKQEDGWRVITIPETATELISGFGIKPFDNCMSMLQFQDFVVGDQIHKEKLALDAAQLVPEDNILILYDRALMDDKAYVSDEEFAQVIARFDGRTEERVLANYDMVLHLITCAKGAEFAYDLANNARTESIEFAREMDDRTLRAWSAHPNLRIIDNDANFNNKIERALREIYRAVGEVEPMAQKRKYLIAMPDMAAFFPQIPRRGHRHDADVSRADEPEHRAPRAHAEKRRGDAVLLHRKASHGKRRKMGHRAPHLAKAV